MSEATPRLVIIETSGRAGQVALAEGDRVLGVRRLDEARRHARDLVPALAELLAEQQWTPREIHGVIVNRGPGSYTGLRVGIISAKAFAYVTGCALLGVESFAALALQVPEPARRIDVIADAQQGKVYVQRFARDPDTGRWSVESVLQIQKVTEWVSALPSGVWVTGPALHIYQERLRPATERADSAAWDPEPQSVLQLGLERFRRDERDDVWTLEPMYLRPSSAEEKLPTTVG
jgi:tRNA threonylcarbamoyladenosine biosynthesis protein TsaB